MDSFESHVTFASDASYCKSKVIPSIHTGVQRMSSRATAKPQSLKSADIEVFYDGDCPLCLREIGVLRRMDRQGRIQFTNIAAPDFDESRSPVDWDTLMGRLHARLSDGQLISGVEVLRRLYAAVGLGPIVWLTRLPGISHLMEFGYDVFSRNRLRLTGRCDSTCRPRFEASASQR
jgi:predicted DCC family thiol-disulfide oxidoreductase YuxK